ncbi:hypothetical protein SAMN02745134_00341 [Clostridium acidisoli DSM 12555]|uniref:Uncharacterized protein n=1 Tax=Clostridium acidisoli DSM 12555 TaxID=1121291 RepID=A0A1W1X0N8_9CLOT|nr:hypothetical protein [Clostridium acidisoli]SMC17474.1 hypothetical protein SAMN02745134_00341 [Clostridium acidisoli DSM 12555]
MSKWKHSLHISKYESDPDYFDKYYGNKIIYLTFICCYNVMHEIGHVLCREYNYKFDKNLAHNDALNQFHEELLVNDFAAAYWHKFGQKEFLDKILMYVNKFIDKSEVQYGWDNLTKKLFKINYENYKIVYSSYASLSFLTKQLVFSRDDNYSKHYDNFQNFSIKESLYKNIDLNILLKEIGINNFCSFKDCNRLNYDYNINTPKEVISDVTKIFLGHGIQISPIEYYLENDKGCNYMCSEPIKDK